MSAHTFLLVRDVKDCPVWEVVEPVGVIVRSSPDTRPEANNIIDTFAAGLLVERVDDIEYPDLRTDSGAVFFRVVVSYNPLISGFVAQRIVNATGRVDSLLLQTVSSLAACKILGTERVKTCCRD